MKINIDKYKITQILTFFAFVLIFIHIIVQFSVHHFEISRSTHIVKLFDLDTEQSLPTVFSVLMLFLAAILLFIISRHKWRVRAPFRVFWSILCFIFLFLALDEFYEIHERLLDIELLDDLTEVSSIFKFSWIVPYGSVLLIFLLMSIQFLRHLQPRSRNLFILSGTIFVTGAIGLEMVGGVIFEESGKSSLLWVISITIEETLEIFGVLLFIFTLLDYISLNGERLSISIE